MTIQYLNGNVLETEAKIIAHQVNCMGIMGAGLAKQIATKYPNVNKIYTEVCLENQDWNILGQTLLIETTDSKIIANCFAQIKPGYGLQTNYPALKKCLETIEAYAKKNGHSIAIPYKIGCGLAGGDWKIVEKMIKDIFEKSTVQLYIYKL